MLGWIATPAPAQPIVAPLPPLVATRSETDARAENASLYAARHAVTTDIAAARLRAQDETVAETDRIAALYRDRLAGIVIEHEPAYRIVVHLTGGDPVPDTLFATDDLSVPILFATGAAATRATILAAIAAHRADIRAALLDPPGMGVDAATGRLALAVGGDDADLEGLAAIEARIGALVGVPVRAFVLGRDANLALAGGERLESVDRVARRVFRCTAGFLVTDGVRSGLATAAHCPDQLYLVGADGGRMPLPLLGAWGAGGQDVQIGAVAGTPAALVHAGADPAALRPVRGSRPRASLRVGDVVCHQGISSGYSCAEVRFTDYAPPGDLCAGPCPPRWVMIAGPDCARGDSGGPVLIGTTAIGIVKGAGFAPDGRCTAYYAMPIDALPAGWRLLVDPG